MALNEKILDFVKLRGPVLQNSVRKHFKMDSTFMGAYLSQLIAEKKIMYSELKIGTSPIYYSEGQEAKLQDFSKYLNEKDKRAYDLLKNNKVLCDNEQEPLIRVALRTIKDFATPVKVNLASGSELFWKWYMIDNNEAEQLIKQIVLPKKQEVEEKEVQNRLNNFNEKKVEEPKPEEKGENSELKKDIIKLKEELSKQKTLFEQLQQKIKESNQESEDIIPVQTRMEAEEDAFFKEIYAYLTEKEIQVIDFEIVKKVSEIDLILNVPTNIGHIKYYCKARNKKKCNEGELSAAYVRGIMKKLPVFFVTTGEVTKKAQIYLQENFQNMILQQI